ncbi:MAG: Rieske 2Fe-2S domain-containing protein, partial [Cellvibrionaceae bacterium]|nr:Rieske 2Fe-2S domain-containing protein [Cellvibrionaceae bacterium]
LLLNQCPHQQAPLYQDTRPASIKDGFLRCPVHGMRFHLATGGTTDGCNNRLQYLTPVYEGNKVGVVL